MAISVPSKALPRRKDSSASQKEISSEDQKHCRTCYCVRLTVLGLLFQVSGWRRKNISKKVREIQQFCLSSHHSVRSSMAIFERRILPPLPSVSDSGRWVTSRAREQGGRHGCASDGATSLGGTNRDPTMKNMTVPRVVRKELRNRYRYIYGVVARSGPAAAIRAEGRPFDASRRPDILLRAAKR